jgi:release factor glutamine methyltransferase
MISERRIASEASGGSLRRALVSAIGRLSKAGVDTARLDAEVLLGHILNVTRGQLISMLEVTLSDEQESLYETALARRLEREPVAYISAKQEFWSLDFAVTPDVLIPRPETERLVEVALMMAARMNSTPLAILDVGTGSGAVAISLAKELTTAQVWATDVSLAALDVARGNAARHGLGERVKFLCGDLFVPVEGEKFSMIVANPPYVCSREIADLAPEVSRWEPRAALDGGVDGLKFSRAMAKHSWRFLAPDGVIVVEVGANQGPAVKEQFIGTGRYANVILFQDYAGRDRVVAARNCISMAG